MSNAHLHERSKYINVSYHFIRDLAEKNALKVDFVLTAKIIADSMTKPLARIAFKRFKGQLRLLR